MKKRIFIATLIFFGAALFGIKKNFVTKEDFLFVDQDSKKMQKEKIIEFLNSVEQKREDFLFSSMLKGDAAALDLQLEFTKKIKEYDLLEGAYQQEVGLYSQLLLKHIDNPNHSDLVMAFQKSDRLLNELLAINLKINELAEQLQNRYKQEIEKNEI